MMFVENFSIRSKLIGIILVSTISALTIGFTLIILINIRSLERDMVDNTMVIARVIGDYSVGPLGFHFQEEAIDALNKLEGIQEIQYAYLYDKDNRFFAAYTNPQYPASSALPNLDISKISASNISASNAEFRNGTLHIYHRIIFKREFYGTIYLQATTAFLAVKIRSYIITMASTGVGLILISLVLAIPLQRLISVPLAELSGIVQKISHDADYSIRFTRHGNDEIGILADGFNNMVSQIQHREDERDKAQEALARALREDFRDTVRNLQNLIYKTSRRNDGKYIFTLFEGKLSQNISGEDILNRTIGEAFGEKYAIEFTPNFDLAFQGVPSQFEMYFRKRCFLNVLEPIVENGVVREVVGSAVDITGQKESENRLRVSEQRYKALVEGLPVGILQSVKYSATNGSLHSGVRLEFVNSEFVRQTGYPVELFSEMARNDSMNLPIHADDKVLCEQKWVEWVDSHTHLMLYRTYRLQIRPNEYRWFDDYATKFAIETGEIIIIQALLDVTEKKVSEEQLEKSLKKEREVNALKSRFVSTVSHEFRTPLTGILLSVDILNRYNDRLSKEQRHDELEKVRNRVNELTNLMNDFLAQSESESIAGKFKPVHIDIVSLCKNVISEMESVTTGGYPGRITQKFELAKAIVDGDNKLLRHVLRNLISNAVKYSPDDHSTVIISIKEDSLHVVIDVTDSGIGIPEQDMEQLFTPFFRASNASKISGTGMGLSIVKEFTELHGGTIDIHSVAGIGSTFTVRLPLASV